MAGRVIKAYWGSGSSPARIMLLGLEEKGLKYESHLLSFSKHEHKSPEVLAINPRGKVPTMLDGDVPVYESLAIIQYLERVYPEPRLLPTDPKGAAETLTRMQETLYLSENISAAARHNSAADKNDAWKARLEELKGKINDELSFWDKTLKGKKFVTGEHVSLADVAFFPWIAQCVRFGLNISKYPSLDEYHKHFSSRPSAVNSYPPHWKEGPGPKILD
eukprot:Phypoly_transcript_15787.p1 GENE.Phypoly_transcript_15787~~Phypoly_transcript_15787.p1  ORF type:complete len:219 (+),score=38.89 Phypoly_transcript_15787:79-735(+)